MKERKSKRTTKRGKKISFNDRAGFIVNAFREMPEKRFTLKYLAAASGGADREGRNLTMSILDHLLEQGYIECEGRGKYHLSRSKMPRYEGVVDMSASGAMYVQCEELESDVFVHQRNTRNALNGDRVEVIVTHTSRNGAKEGEISKVLERSHRCYAGRVDIASKTTAIVVPDSRKMPVDIAISLKKYPHLKQDDKVAVRIVDWRNGDRLPQGELVDVLGEAGDNDAEMHAILLEYDLPYKFEEQVVKAAEAIDGRITERDIAERRDMRQVPTLTIDPADAKDFDDALSIRPIGDGKWEVGVHIADVTHYVKPDTTIDDEAVERGTSVYLVDRTIPMLPERLCTLPLVLVYLHVLDPVTL